MNIDIIQPLLDWVATHPEVAGLIVFLVAAGESLVLVGILVPGVVFMLSIGTLVGLGAIDLWAALIWAALGAIAGDWLSYWIGRHYDRQLRHLWPLSRYPKLIPAGEKFFKRHGGKSILFGRFVGPLRPIIPAVAGIMHMSPVKFYIINVISAILWAPVVILPGVVFGESLQLADTVFNNLIALVVIVIIVVTLLGYIAKKLFSYMLLTTVTTWSELFGFDRAKENFASFSLATVLVLVVSLFVVQYEYRHQSIVPHKQAASYSWWKSNWQQFSLVPVEFHGDYPINIQWWGTLNKVTDILQQQGWQHSLKITPRNSLHYFLPEPDAVTLPLGSSTLFSAQEAVSMVKRGVDGRHYRVIRLWAAHSRSVARESKLWVGVIYDVYLLSPLGLVHVPVSEENYSQSISKLMAEISSNSNLLFQRSYYRNIGVTDSWRGDVLLLEFNDVQVSANNQDQSAQNFAAKDQNVQHRNNQLMRYQLNGAQLSLLSPGAFTGSLSDGYSYVHNGITVGINRIKNNPGDTFGFSHIRDEIRSQLTHPVNLTMISIEEDSFVEEKMKGAQFTVHYKMPFDEKKMIYRVKLIDKPGDTWVATGVYKQCDLPGGRVVSTMLDSVKLHNTF